MMVCTAARGLAAALLLVAAHAVHAGPSAAEVGTLCANAEDASHCGRLVEARQLARLAGIATRDGDELRVALYPAGTAVFRDRVATDGVRTYALWDALSPINAVVLYAVDGERTGFVLLQRTNGRTTALPAEPVLSPDRRYVATADFCAEGCDNEVALWRVTREDVRKERAWRPAGAWTDVTVEWQGAERLTLEHAGTQGAAPERVEVRLDDARWRPAR